MPTWKIIHADCREAMAGMEENSIDAIACDPPYGLEFMGKGWDKLGAVTEEVTEGMDASHPFRDGSRRVRYGSSARTAQQWHESWAREALRVLKPGGHLVAFGGTRTFHRMTCAIEDAGFEVRDCLTWVYGSGFPKSLDVSKAIDKAAGEQRARVPGTTGSNNTASRGTYRPGEAISGEAISGEAIRWQGWGTTLKPAWEPIILARKPISEKNIAANVLRWGTGALNIDGCRIETADDLNGGAYAEVGGRLVSPSLSDTGMNVAGKTTGREFVNPPGRWPANLILGCECEGEEHEPACAVTMLDAQSGELGSGAFSGHRNSPKTKHAFGEFELRDEKPAGFGDTGGASRFFYQAKTPRTEREMGLGEMGLGEMGRKTLGEYPADPGKSGSAKARNHHPTVKPVELMRWLVKLITPPGGTVLDPFAGSGSTGIAALRENFSFIGIEQDESYCEIARVRIGSDSPLFMQGG